MKETFRDAGHLVRLVAALAAGIVIFLAVREAAVPKTFGRYGHYRAGALDDIRAKPIIYAGPADCAVCHEDQAKARATGKHSGISCEACHGPLANHIDDPSAHKPKLPAVVALCSSCHEKDSAKPKWFPQVVSKDHSNGVECNSCHQPHAPRM